jgi:hypothetical protein
MLIALSVLWWHGLAMDRDIQCLGGSLVTVRRSVEYHLTDWFDE